MRCDNRVASSEIEGDGPTGTLTSPEFKIARKYISFRIGGGDYERDTCVNLLVDGKVVKSATGWRSDRLAPASWDVSRFLGRNAQIQIVDEASGDWGHINVDHIVQTDTPERLPVATGAALPGVIASRNFTSLPGNGRWTGSIPACNRKAGSMTLTA